MRPVRTLIVDDSASMRATLAQMLAADPDIEVVGAAPEPYAAREMIRSLDPDVITLDVEMPGMDGLSFLERIMRLRPMPVVMCSTLTERGAQVTIEALRLGAVDYVAKPKGCPEEIAQQASVLRSKVKAAAGAHVRQHSTPKLLDRVGTAADMVIAVGASTGGVEALFRLLKPLPADCPPVLVVQHMSAGFTQSFAAGLDAECRAHVVEALDGAPVEPGTVYIAPGGTEHMELQGGPRGRIRLRPGDRYSGHRPSVDLLFHSMVPLGKAAIGVILTGMGSDGAEGLLAMRRAGARTFGQSQESCVVYGMPRAAMTAGAVEVEKRLSDLPAAILAACSAERRTGIA